MEKTKSECENGCLRYRQSMDEVILAGQKHKEKLISIKVIADDQKQKISNLRAEKYKLQDEIDKLELDAQETHAQLMNKHKENMNLKILLKDAKNKFDEDEKLVTRNEIISLQSKVQALSRKNTDLEDEILEKGIEVLHLSEENEHFKRMESKLPSLHNELVHETVKEADLRNRCKRLEADLKDFKENESLERKERIDLLKHIETIENSKKEQIEDLKENISKLKQKTFPTCWYGKRCTRRFCRFDHSAIFRKVNKRLEINKNMMNEMSLCEKCGDSFEDHQSFSRHIQSCLGETQQSVQIILKCEDCDFNYVKKAELDIHVTQNHKETEIECEQCGMYFVTIEELDVHRTTHINHTLQGLLEEQEKSFLCNSCNETFVTKKSLRRHSQKYQKLVKDGICQKNIQKQFKNRKLDCGMCRMDLTSVENMDSHMDDKHEGRWKINDPDIVYDGESCSESSTDSSVTDDDEDESNTVSEDSETQSGEE